MRSKGYIVKAFKKNKTLTVLTMFSLLFIFYAAYLQRLVFTNQDGLSYVAIAQHYLNGNFDVAINAYWSPFVSWLMVPFIALGVDGLFSFMLVNALAATLILLSGLYIVRQHTKDKISGILYVVTITPFLMFSLSQTTPDIWLAAWAMTLVMAVYIVEKILKDNSTKSYIKAGLIFGLVGVAGYFIKLYSVPVFIVFLGLWMLLHLFTNKKRPKKITQSIKKPIILIIVSIITAITFLTPWLLALSNKYEIFTPGSSLAHNIRIGSKGQPKVESELLTPQFPQDPTYFKQSVDSKRPKDANIFKYYFSETLKSAPLYVNRINSISPFILLIIIGLFAAIIFGKVKYRSDLDKTLVSAAILFSVYFGGYAVVTGASSGEGNARYYWPLMPIAVLIFSLTFYSLWRLVKNQLLWQKAILISVALLFPISILAQYTLTLIYPHTINIVRGQKIIEPQKIEFNLLESNNRKKDRQNLAEQISDRNIIESGKKIVGNNQRGVLYLAYETKTISYFYKDGPISENVEAAFLKDLKNESVDYYIHFSKNEPTPDQLSLLKPQTIFETNLEKYRCSDEKEANYEKCFIRILRIH